MCVVQQNRCSFLLHMEECAAAAGATFEAERHAQGAGCSGHGTMGVSNRMRHAECNMNMHHKRGPCTARNNGDKAGQVGRALLDRAGHQDSLLVAEDFRRVQFCHCCSRCPQRRCHLLPAAAGIAAAAAAAVARGRHECRAARCWGCRRSAGGEKG
jgi:hypothetical protein